MAIQPTGYEQKPLRVVIENWLYNRNFNDSLSALHELRIRFTRVFTKPDWAKNTGSE